MSLSAGCVTLRRAGGSHLEMQSRSIDSYVHAIHSFQEFDVGDIDFADPVQAEKYALEIEIPFPKHGITNCEACHVAGTNNVPNQSKSLPGLLSASDVLTGQGQNHRRHTVLCHRSRYAGLWWLPPCSTDQ